MNVVLLVEELSMKRFLEGLLPRLVPDDVGVTVIAHEGKSDLEKSLPRKLKAWRQPNTHFFVLRDQDSGDCKAMKAHLLAICKAAGKADVVVRIVCRELEAWYFGDLRAAAHVLDASRLEALAGKAMYRDPDLLDKPSRRLAKLVPAFGKVGAATSMGAAVDLDANTSRSFKLFVRTIRSLVQP